MYEIGVNWFTRTIACSLYPTATNRNLGGDTVGIDTASTFKSTSIDFEFGLPFDETTGDGTKVKTTATLSGNTLIMDQNHTIPGKPEIKSVRVYKKISG